MTDQPTKSIDTKLFEEIRKHALDLKATHKERDSQLEEYDNMYLVRWQESNKKKWKQMNARVTISPDPRMEVLGALRLLIATDPIFKATSQDPTFDAEKIERAITRWWDQSGKVNRRPIHFDSLLSGILYGEMHTSITPMKDLVQRIDPKRKKRAERRAAMVPFLIENWTPKGAYAEDDQFGTCGYYLTQETNLQRIKSDFRYLPGSYANAPRFQTVTKNVWYDLDYCCIWLSGGQDAGTPIYLDEHGWTEIPVSVSLVDGSKLFTKPEDKSQPLLFGLLRSNLWTQQNLGLTILYTMLYGIGATPMFVHTNAPNTPDKELDLNFDEPGGTIELAAGEQLTPLMTKGIIPPELREGYQLAVQKGEESTIYKEAMGQPPDRATTFSAQSLLAQQGRLPLIGPQRLGGQGISQIIELGLRMLKEDGTSFDDNGIELKPSEIPDDLQIETKLEVKLPQDRLQLANIASILKQSRLAPDDWIQENVLQITDAKGARRSIWFQDATTSLVQRYINKRLVEIDQPPQAPGGAPPGEQPGGAPPGAPPPQQQLPPGPEQQQGMPPEMQAEMQRRAQEQFMQQGASPGQPGAPMQGGLPQAQGGMVPGPGEGEMPQ